MTHRPSGPDERAWGGAIEGQTRTWLQWLPDVLISIESALQPACDPPNHNCRRKRENPRYQPWNAPTARNIDNRQCYYRSNDYGDDGVSFTRIAAHSQNMPISLNVSNGSLCLSPLLRLKPDGRLSLRSKPDRPAEGQSRVDSGLAAIGDRTFNSRLAWRKRSGYDC